MPVQHRICSPGFPHTRTNACAVYVPKLAIDNMQGSDVRYASTWFRKQHCSRHASSMQRCAGAVRHTFRLQQIKLSMRSCHTACAVVTQHLDCRRSESLSVRTSTARAVRTSSSKALTGLGTHRYTLVPAYNAELLLRAELAADTGAAMPTG